LALGNGNQRKKLKVCFYYLYFHRV